MTSLYSTSRDVEGCNMSTMPSLCLTECATSLISTESLIAQEVAAVESPERLSMTVSCASYNETWDHDSSVSCRADTESRRTQTSAEPFDEGSSKKSSYNVSVQRTAMTLRPFVVGDHRPAACRRAST